jgi:crotonobetainyl-CoA:carnitine CoA-transferase CaiB-like acyl-CoA transferase
MPGILSGLRVLDLSWGIAGPMAAMVLADHGADVVKIEPPGGDPFRDLGRCRLGYKTWQRGKRSAILDLETPEDLETFETLAKHADVVVESFGPGVTQNLGIDFDTLAKDNPGLIYATIDGYGETSQKGRPAIDLLVGARMGLQWEHRGWPEGTMLHTSKLPDPFPDLEVPYDWLQGPPREGPMVLGVPTASMGAFYAIMTAISAALFVREKTGRGQRVRTSLMQGAAAALHSAWQRAENPFVEGFQTWVKSSRSPKGHFQCADGRWIHNWVANPRFILSAAEGDKLDATPDLSVQTDPNRFGTEPEEIFVINHYQPLMAEAVRKFPAREWVEAGAIADIPIQEVRSPEEALSDPVNLADGCVREIEDPELGTIRQLGALLDFEKTPCSPGGPAPRAGEHTAEVKAEARRLGAAAVDGVKDKGVHLKSPLDGVRVIDLGLAVAGPYGCQVLGDLGADVIKINAFHDSYWHRNHLSFITNRSKRSLCINLKDPKSREIMIDLIKTADVVQHNMRYEAARRLGLDYETLKAIKPDLIYCHLRGYERGPRETLPANEQTAACVAGVQYEDGAMANGGRPIWNFTMFGDTGTGYLSAIGILHALRHRERTGEGQFLTTAIVNAQLLSCSSVVARPDGGAFDRPLLDRMQYGFSALYGLYETADRWLALAALRDGEWEALKSAAPAGALDDPRFATQASRAANDGALRGALEAIFRGETAERWFQRLDGAGVPCEICDETLSQRAQDDPEFKDLGLAISFEHPLVGRCDQVGAPYQLSDTPAAVRLGPLVLGDGTWDVLAELGYSPERINRLAEERCVGVWRPGDPLLDGPRHYIGGGAAREKSPEKV